MKKLMIVIGLMLSMGVVKAQTDSVYIVKFVDEMADEFYLVPSTRIVVANEDNTKGFIIDAFINENFELRTLFVEMVGMGSCNENDKIIIQLDNGEKINATSWKDFNCEGQSYFRLTSSDIQKLKSSPISKIRMTNGRTYDTFTGDVESDQKRWFIQLFYALDNRLFTEKVTE